MFASGLWYISTFVTCTTAIHISTLRECAQERDWQTSRRRFSLDLKREADNKPINDGNVFSQMKATNKLCAVLI